MEKENILEVCAASLASVKEAAAGGASRIELCSALGEGGVTPSAGFISMAGKVAADAGMRMHVLIRPRGGDFVYDADGMHGCRHTHGQAVRCRRRGYRGIAS